MACYKGIVGRCARCDRASPDASSLSSAAASAAAAPAAALRLCLLSGLARLCLLCPNHGARRVRCAPALRSTRFPEAGVNRNLKRYHACTQPRLWCPVSVLVCRVLRKRAPGRLTSLYSSHKRHARRTCTMHMLQRAPMGYRTGVGCKQLCHFSCTFC